MGFVFSMYVRNSTSRFITGWFCTLCPSALSMR